MTIKYVIRTNSQLTSMQKYVWCKDARTAEAVRARFEKNPESVTKYKWVSDAPFADVDHWCVAQDVQWATARTREVRTGQWYIGIFSKESALDICDDVVCGDDTVDDYRAGVGPIQDTGYVIVNTHEHANPVEICCLREQVKDGECFEYLGPSDTAGGIKYVAADDPTKVPMLPTDWAISTTWSARTRLKDKVKRIPRWDANTPVILPCIDPLDRLLKQLASGLTGADCLYRLQIAMRTESVARVGDGFVSTDADAALDREQFALGMQCWTAKVKELSAATRERDRADREIACDPVDEMPNMAEVP